MFYRFQIVAETGQDPTGEYRSPNLGFFAVNRFTGDVWDASVCIHRSSDVIRQTKKHLRARATRATRVFERRQAMMPCETHQHRHR